MKAKLLIALFGLLLILGTTSCVTPRHAKRTSPQERSSSRTCQEETRQESGQVRYSGTPQAASSAGLRNRNSPFGPAFSGSVRRGKEEITTLFSYLTKKISL